MGLALCGNQHIDAASKPTFQPSNVGLTTFTNLEDVLVVLADADLEERGRGVRFDFLTVDRVAHAAFVGSPLTLCSPPPS